MEEMRRYAQCLYPRTNLSETGPFSEPVTIDHKMLCDDILLKIFQQYLDAAPRLWPILNTYAEDGNRSYWGHLWVYSFDFTARTGRRS
jgi:hypothetical protein